MLKKAGDYLNTIKQNYPHNYRVFILFDLIWGLSVPFGSALVPAFMVELGSSKKLIGLVASLPMLAGVVQIVVSHCFRHNPKKRWLSLSYFAAMVPWMMFNLFFFWNTQVGSNSLRLTLFCVVQAAYWLISSGNEGIRLSMLTECTPLNKRGSLFGSRTVILIVAALTIWPVASWVQKQWSEPQNYLASFAIASFFCMACSFVYLWTREYRNPEIDNGSDNHGPSQIISDTRATVKDLLTDYRYRIFLLNTVILYASRGMASFIVVYAKEQMHLSGSKIIQFTILNMLGGAVATKILGKLADRIGYRKVGGLLAIPLTCGFLLAVVFAVIPKINLWVVFASFVLCASMVPVSTMVGVNLAIELRPRKNIGMLLSVNNALMLPVMLIAIPLGGWVVDQTGTYVPVFLIGAIGAIVAGLGFTYFVTEPRKTNIDTNVSLM